jgi:hypothetical protein
MADPLTTRDLAGRPDAHAEDAESGTERTSESENEAVDETASNDPSSAIDDESGAAPRQESLDAAPAGDEEETTEREPLLPNDQTERFTDRWREIQTGFVDRPRESVEQADALVADLMQRLAASFSNERERLEAEWDAGDDVSTEDLRVVLTRYRSFFDRLLSA